VTLCSNGLSSDLLTHLCVFSYSLLDQMTLFFFLGQKQVLVHSDSRLY